ncbi:fructokinase [Sinomonas cellulolyticus]|uniref:Carbohydrate kinase n=1 Tax=Sinomonas cellulolyticus TaxID=2801916 RepID=A0ABS1K5V5_9MICC|nr:MULTISPECIES: carbohydrate kinase [Sinomonas]MBL0706858.1 carbohydrate kinase [Sinomonas cellulolyticus]GHG52830.1 fructokinase [Sinomonas sp. KCTC 49339]
MLTVIGEGLIDVVRRPAGTEAHPGGSPLNVAVGLARLDHPVQFIGRRGDDANGRLLADHLRVANVLVPLPPDASPTSVAAAELDHRGAATYTFELDWHLPDLRDRLDTLLSATTLVHTGSIAAVLEPGADQVLHLVERARPRATIGFDPNCRPTITTDPEVVRARVERLVALADVVKASDEDLAWLYPGTDPLDSARRWLALGAPEGPAFVVVTRGAEGPWAVAHAGETAVPAPAVRVADTVGAGDSFMAGLLSAVVDRELDGAQRRSELRRLDVRELGRILDFAARAAAVTVSRPGANPPSRAELRAAAGHGADNGGTP